MTKIHTLECWCGRLHQGLTMRTFRHRLRLEKNMNKSLWMSPTGPRHPRSVVAFLAGYFSGRRPRHHRCHQTKHELTASWDINHSGPRKPRLCHRVGGGWQNSPWQ